jgi:glycosyltransferase involved in cell wall biosynthesis
MKLVAQVCMYNEVEKGNLERCLINLKHYCDDIVIYDDASTDNSVEVARKYTDHIILGEVNNQMQELAHKQQLLEYAIRLGGTHLFWLDCDEVLTRQGTEGGLRDLCEHWPKRVDAFSFKELNLWRSERWIRTDTLFDKGHFVRLYKVVPGISFEVVNGVHKRLYPQTIERIRSAPFGVIHYGFHDYHKMMVKIGAHQFTKEELMDNAETNWILDERNCACYYAPDDLYPEGLIPTKDWPQPQPRSLDELQTYLELEAR